MKLKIEKVEKCGIHPVFSTNVKDNRNYLIDNGTLHKNCVVDEDYQGEVHIHMTNVGKEPVTIAPGDKIVQFILLPVLYAQPVEVPIEELYEQETERGAGGFGSTDKK